MNAQNQEDKMIETQEMIEITETTDQEEILTEIERIDLSNVIIVNKMVIFQRIVKMKKLKDLIEDKIKEQDAINVRSLGI